MTTQTISLFNTKHSVELWTTPKTLEPQWKNRLKELRIGSGLHSQKVELSRVKYFYAFVSNSQLCLSHLCKQWHKKMNLDRKLSTCLTTNYKERINSRESGIFPTSVTELCHAICYVFKKLKRFLFYFYINWIPKILVQFCYFQDYILALMLFPVVSCNGLQGLKMDWNKIQDIQQPVNYETDSDNKSDDEGDFEVVYSGTCMTRSGRSVRDHDWCVWPGCTLMVIRLI